jgi:hypothetical protein
MRSTFHYVIGVINAEKAKSCDDAESGYLLCVKSLLDRALLIVLGISVKALMCFDGYFSAALCQRRERSLNKASQTRAVKVLTEHKNSNFRGRGN